MVDIFERAQNFSAVALPERATGLQWQYIGQYSGMALLMSVEHR